MTDEVFSMKLPTAALSRSAFRLEGCADSPRRGPMEGIAAYQSISSRLALLRMWWGSNSMRLMAERSKEAVPHLESVL